MTGRGAYAKGIAKREEILARALEVVARQGYRGASVKEIADAVGLSQAGLLHYFDSKEQLFAEILRARDDLDMPEETPLTGLDWAEARDGYLRVVGHNAEVPGLVQLFSRVAVDAADPDHVAHAYFLERTRGLQDTLGAVVRRAQAEGAVADDLDPDLVARMIQAVSDGIQLQFLQDPQVDMAAVVGELMSVLARTGRRA